MRTFWLLFIILFAVLWLLLVITSRPARAESCAVRVATCEYTADDTLAAIGQASAEIGVSEAWLYRTVDCETGGTFSNYLVGRQGELGAAQLHPRGLLPKFYALGYLDPLSPYQSIRYMAQEFSFGRASAWSCS